MIFVPLSAEIARKALEGQENVLTKAVKEHEEYFRKLSCPSCGQECMAFLDANRLFREGALLPNYLARCKGCGVEFEPYTKIMLTTAHPSKVTF